MGRTQFPYTVTPTRPAVHIQGLISAQGRLQLPDKEADKGEAGAGSGWCVALLCSTGGEAHLTWHWAAPLFDP